ncbi:MAG: radical SAM family heme chaperone HemW [Planctomycetaceae bacterium]
MNTPSLYLHIPFCETKCPYCDFNSFALEGRDVDGYLDALRREMDARGVPPNPPTIFVGGGTPTVVSPAHLERYLGDLVRRVRPDPAREFTVEANPGSFTAEKAAILAAHGVNRVSLGAQSFFAHHLRALGRVHEVGQIAEAVAHVRAAGIPRLNLDLIHAVPGLTLAEWSSSLDAALDLEPDHLSCYALIFEPGTEFFARRAAGKMRAVPEELELGMFRLTERKLRRAGLFRYEVSNFARPGQECRHNLGYWRNFPYAGFGAGAFSYLDGERFGNERNLARYADAVRATGGAVVSRERLLGREAAGEEVMLAIRTAEGVDLSAVARRHGLDAEREFGPTVERLLGERLVESEGRLRLARRGWRVADAVAAAFL